MLQTRKPDEAEVAIDQAFFLSFNLKTVSEVTWNRTLDLKILARTFDFTAIAIKH